MSLVRSTVLFDSPLLRIVDIVCRHPRGGCGCERGGERTHLALLRRGGFGYHLRGTTHVGDPTVGLLYRAGDTYRISHPFDGGDACSSFEVAIEHEEELFGRRRNGPVDASRPVEPCDHYRHRVMHVALAQGQRDPLSIEECAIGLCQDVLQRHIRPAAPLRMPASAMRRVRQVQGILLADPTNPAGLSELAREAGSSPCHLARMFHRATGTRITTYRTRLRIALALDRLAEGADNLAALACELGFSHHSHFGAAFRQHVGLTPRHARASLRPSALARARKNLIDPRRPAA